MRANSIAIAFLLAALSLLVIVVGVVVLLFVADRLDQILNPDPKQVLRHAGSDTEFAMRDGIVNIPIKLKLCVEDSDCAVVADHCGDCSCGTEINKQYIARYNKQFDALCDIYFERDKVVTCDIYCKPKQTKCVEGICGS